MDEYGSQPVLQKVIISPVAEHIDLLGKRRPESGRGDEAASSWTSGWIFSKSVGIAMAHVSEVPMDYICASIQSRLRAFYVIFRNTVEKFSWPLIIQFGEIKWYIIMGFF